MGEGGLGGYGVFILKSLLNDPPIKAWTSLYFNLTVENSKSVLIII